MNRIEQKRNLTPLLYQFCWENGGWLAEFFSRHEETRVDDILAVDLHYWIGLTDFAFEGIGVKGISGSYLGVWMWQESHEEVPYQNWCPGEPNNLNGDEDCVEKIGTDMWNDRPCDYNAPHALCQAHP